MRRTRIWAFAGLVVGVVALASPAYATVTEANGNTNPSTQNPGGQCAAGERWVYASSGAESMYNPLAKTTDSLGASSVAPPNSNADAFKDGVTIAINATGGASASFFVNEAIDPTTTVTLGKVIAKAGNHYTVYTGTNAPQNTALTSPANARPPVMAISHAYVCYSVATTPPATPEVPYPIVLPIGGVAVGGIVLTFRRRRRLRAA
jgi:hypothetical protein